MQKFNLSTPQPPPIPNNNKSIHDLVIDDLKNNHPAQLWLAEDLLDRKRFGLEKYNTLLQAGNGRNSATDAFQEALDAIVYIKKEQEETKTDKLDFAYYFAIMLADELKGYIDNTSSTTFRR